MRNKFNFLKELDSSDLPLSGAIILMGIAGLHMTSAGLDIIESVKASALGSDLLGELTDFGFGLFLASLPFLIVRFRRFQAARRDAQNKDCSFS